MKLSYFTGLILSLLLLTGCGSLVQEVDPALIPTSTAKLVIHSYLSPQDTVLVVLVEAPQAVVGLQSSGSFGRRTIIPNAAVTLSNGVETVRVPFSGQDLVYRLPASRLPILAGRTYRLTVSAPGYKATTGQCTVPAAVEPTNILIDSVRSVQGQGSSVRYFSRLVWQDPPGIANYYSINGVSRFDVRRRNTVTQRDTTITESRQLQFDGGSRVVSDLNRDGQRILSGTLTDFNNFYQGPDATGSINNVRLTLTLLTVEETYFRYQAALGRYQNAGDNPFAEPVLIPSNIENGLGCFAAFNQATLTVRVK